jgi:L-ribulose-5-phosphate 4-epimerase
MANKYLQIAAECIKQNKELIKKRLVIHNFGNVSLRVDKDHFIIKPSGANLSTLKPADMPIINIQSKKKIKGKLKPSTDTPTHLEIYKKFSNIKSITHNHSTYATAWAQSAKPIPLIGTTHADFWKDEVPVVDFLSLKDLNDNYEKHTGKLILKTLQDKKLNAYTCPGVIVAGHGPFTWGSQYNSSVINAEVLEFVAKTTYLSTVIKIKKKLPKYISNKHYLRKHGKNAYYGQA